MRRTLALALFAAVLCTGSSQAMELGRVDHQGVRLVVSMVTLGRFEGQPPLGAGQRVRIAVDIRDTTTGKVFNGLFPAAWIHPRDASGASCTDKVQSFVAGGLFSQAQLDLNTYRVLTLNEDPSISVIDPQFGFGNGRLLRNVQLPAPGFDWLRTPNYSAVFVSTPGARQVLRLETATWDSISNHVPTEYGAPRHLALQPDARYLWVALGDSVAVLESGDLRPVARIPTGRHPVTIVFTPDSQFAFVANYAADSVSVIDVAGLRKIKDIPTARGPAAMDYSALAEALYVAHQKDGQVAVIDGYEHEIVARVRSEPGLSVLRFTPNQRWGLMVNPRSNRLSVLDSANNRIVNTGLVDKGPEQIAFSRELAYIRHRHSNQLLMLTLGEPALGQPGKPIPVVDTPGGDLPPGRMGMPTPALGIQQVPGAEAVVISNPADRALYFYKEGMAAPMGQFLTGKHAARAVLTLDRSLKEHRRPGHYETVTNLPEVGEYELILFLDSPRFTHCIPLDIHPVQPGYRPTTSPEESE